MIGIQATLLIGCGRLGGHGVGTVANQPAVLAVMRDIDSSGNV